MLDLEKLQEELFVLADYWEERGDSRAKYARATVMKSVPIAKELTYSPAAKLLALATEEERIAFLLDEMARALVLVRCFGGHVRRRVDDAMEAVRFKLEHYPRERWDSCSIAYTGAHQAAVWAHNAAELKIHEDVYGQRPLAGSHICEQHMIHAAHFLLHASRWNDVDSTVNGLEMTHIAIRQDAHELGCDSPSRADLYEASVDRLMQILWGTSPVTKKGESDDDD